MFFSRIEIFIILSKSPGVLTFLFCASVIILLTSRLLIGLSGSIFVITTPDVLGGNFLFLISSFVNCLNSAFKFSTLYDLLCLGFDALKSSDVSSLPKVIFL